MVNIPENPYDRILTSAEVKELLEDGWRQGNMSECQDCFGSGCDKCHKAGIIGHYYKGGKFAFGAPYFQSSDSVGATCHVNHFGLYDQRIHFFARGCGGQAEIIFTVPQMVRLMKMTVNILDAVRANHEEEFGVEAKFRGPPSMSLASLSKDRVTIAMIPSENQRKALELLNEAGLKEEARLLHSAFEHEIFRGDEEENRKAREAVGEIEPGTIFSRKGDKAVVGGVEVSIDPDQTLLGQLATMKK